MEKLPPNCSMFKPDSSVYRLSLTRFAVDCEQPSQGNSSREFSHGPDRYRSCRASNVIHQTWTVLDSVGMLPRLHGFLSLLYY